MRGVFALLLGPLVLAAADARAATPCTYFAAPVLEDGGKAPEGEPYASRFGVGTPDDPITVRGFWDRNLVKPGTVLCLKDGEYRGRDSMIQPPVGAPSGEPGARVVIRAVHDGAVWIDGEFERRPVHLDRLSYWTVRGLNLYNSRGPVVTISGRPESGAKDEGQSQEPSHHIVLSRIVAWRDYIPYGSLAEYDEAGGSDVHIFRLRDVADTVIEDCAGFGWARKVFENHRSKRVVIRRSWARFDGRYPYKGGNKFAFSCAHEGYDALCENLIATVGGSHDLSAQSASYAPGVHLIAADGSAPIDARWLEPAGRDAFSLGLRILGSLAYVSPDARFTRVGGYQVGGNVYPSKGVKGVHIGDSVAAIGSARKRAATLSNCDDDPAKHPDGCSWQLKDDKAKAPLELQDVTLMGAHVPPTRIRSDWQQTGARELGWGASVDVYQGRGGGASLCHRYVDGKETKLPLWPWPMQDRIRVASERSAWPTADVMGDLTSLFGAPPPACTGTAP